MEKLETILEGLLELVRLDMQLRKTGKETAERRQVEDAINSVRAKVAPSQSSAILIKQDDLALCDNCGTYIYLPPDEMVVSPMPPARRSRGRARTPLTHV